MRLLFAKPTEKMNNILSNICILLIYRLSLWELFCVGHSFEVCNWKLYSCCVSLWNYFFNISSSDQRTWNICSRKEIWPHSFSSPQLLSFFLCISLSAFISNFPYYFIAPFPSYRLLAKYCMWDKRWIPKYPLSDCSLLYTPWYLECGRGGKEER